MAVLLSPKGQDHDKVLKGRGKSKTLTMKQLQEAIGGHVTVIFTHTGDPMICDEDGMPKELPYNPRASAAWGRGYLYGNVVMASKEEMAEILAIE